MAFFFHFSEVPKNNQKIRKINKGLNPEPKKNQCNA